VPSFLLLLSINVNAYTVPRKLMTCPLGRLSRGLLRGKQRMQHLSIVSTEKQHITIGHGSYIHTLLCRGHAHAGHDCHDAGLCAGLVAAVYGRGRGRGRCRLGVHVRVKGREGRQRRRDPDQLPGVEYPV
jgi:hypothetical protein